MASTTDILNHHLQSFGGGDLDALLSDYALDAVLVTQDGVLKGPGEMKGLYEQLFAEFGKPGASFEMLTQTIEGEYAYIVWKAETADNVYEFATDTFHIRGGKIVGQTLAAVVTPKG